MATKEEMRLRLIQNTNERKEVHEVTNPINYEVAELREKLMKFRNDKSVKKFSVEDLLKW